jgi:parallel beta-helix repeat protein
VAEYQRIETGDTLIDWKTKFNENTDYIDQLESRVEQLETGSTDPNGELIAVRTSEVFGTTYPKADDRINAAEQRIKDAEDRLTAAEGKLPPVFNVKQYGAIGNGVEDDAPAIQSALDAAYSAGGGEVYVPSGAYPIKSSLLIYSNTRLHLAHDATIIRADALGNMIRPGIGNVDKYDGVQNVEIVGGTWDGNGSQYPSPFSAISFGHGRGIRIRNTAVLDIYQNHAVEINACQDVEILNTKFSGFTGTRYSEAVQLDIAKSSAQYPWFGNYDDTPCENVLISGCLFENWSRGVGAHSGTTGIRTKNIKIAGNHFRNLTGQAIRTYNWENVVIADNTFDTCRMAIEIKSAESTECGHFTITGNTIRNMNGTEYGYGIWLNGDEIAGTRYAVYDAIVDGNTIEGTVEDGIYAENCVRVTITRNTVTRAGDQGISLSKVDYSTISGNVVSDANYHGIALSESNHNNVSGNVSYSNARSGATGYSNITLVTNSTYNTVIGNTCRTNYSQTRPDYGIQVTSTCTGNMVTSNDLYRGGKTQNLKDDGASITSAGNRV